jgi:hypothetical protein
VSDAFETVHTTFDRLEAEMVAEVLVQEGIDARLIGTTGAALIGVAPHILRLRIEVPCEAAAPAREIVAGLLAPDAATPEAEAAAESESAASPPAEGALGAPAAPTPADDGAADAPAGPPRRRPMLAAGAAFVLPGGSHVYARHPWSGLVLAVGYVATLAVMLAGGGRHAVVASGVLTIVALLLADVVGGQLAVRRANRGPAPSRARQLGRGLVLVVVAAALGSLVGSQVRPPKPKPIPFDYRTRGLPLLDPERPLDPPLVPPELEHFLQRRGAASQPTSSQFLWPPSGIPAPQPPAPQIPR